MPQNDFTNIMNLINLMNFINVVWFELVEMGGVAPPSGTRTPHASFTGLACSVYRFRVEQASNGAGWHLALSFLTRMPRRGPSHFA